MMRAPADRVNRMHSRQCGYADTRMPQKKAGPKRARLRYWPREADTITFQEGLLSSRATGGGGQMRNANAQRAYNIVPRSRVRQPSTPHVSHAETRGQ